MGGLGCAGQADPLCTCCFSAPSRLQRPPPPAPTSSAPQYPSVLRCVRAGQGCQPVSLALRTQGLCTSPALIAQENEPISSPPAGTKLVRLGDEGSCRLFANSLIAFLPPAISPLAHTRTSLHVSNSVTEGKNFPF